MLTPDDLEYIGANFVALQELCRGRGLDVDAVRARIERRELPRPSYTLPDGTEMVPSDFFALDDAAKDETLEALFKRRFASEAREQGLECSEVMLEDEWEGYLSGDYGVCLWSVTPENIVSKGRHMRLIEGLLGDPRPAAREWLDSLSEHVDALDRLERPFAPFDRVRWGRVSRDRLITAAHDEYPQAFSTNRVQPVAAYPRRS